MVGRRGAVQLMKVRGGSARAGIEIERCDMCGMAGVRRLAAARPVGGGAGEAKGGRGVGRGKAYCGSRSALAMRAARSRPADRCSAFAGRGQHGVDVDQVRGSAPAADGRPRRCRASGVTVHDEDAALHLSGIQRAQHVGDVRFQVDGRA